MDKVDSTDEVFTTLEHCLDAKAIFSTTTEGPWLGIMSFSTDPGSLIRLGRSLGYALDYEDDLTSRAC